MSRSIYVETEVEIDADALADAGYHHEDECPGRDELGQAGLDLIPDALASLHRQAHPDEALDVFLCHREPCRSLDMDMLGYPTPLITKPLLFRKAG